MYVQGQLVPVNFMGDLAACGVFVVSSTYHLFSKWVSQTGFLMMIFFHSYCYSQVT
jgi:hypothetical protein